VVADRLNAAVEQGLQIPPITAAELAAMSESSSFVGLVLGPVGSGKSTAAKRLAYLLGGVHSDGDILGIGDKLTRILKAERNFLTISQGARSLLAGVPTFMSSGGGALGLYIGSKFKWVIEEALQSLYGKHVSTVVLVPGERWGLGPLSPEELVELENLYENNLDHILKTCEQRVKDGIWNLDEIPRKKHESDEEFHQRAILELAKRVHGATRGNFRFVLMALEKAANVIRFPAPIGGRTPDPPAEIIAFLQSFKLEPVKQTRLTQLRSIFHVEAFPIGDRSKQINLLGDERIEHETREYAAKGVMVPLEDINNPTTTVDNPVRVIGLNAQREVVFGFIAIGNNSPEESHRHLTIFHGKADYANRALAVRFRAGEDITPENGSLIVQRMPLELFKFLAPVVIA